MGCTSAIKHEICIENDEPFKEWFQHIPPPLLEEVRASLQDMLEAEAICPSQSPWCNAVVLVRKKDVLCASGLILDASTHGQRRIPTLCPTYRRHWKAWWGQHTSHQWISSQASGKSRWCRSHSNTQPTWWVTLGSTSSLTCHSGCVMPP